MNHQIMGMTYERTMVKCSAWFVPIFIIMFASIAVSVSGCAVVDVVQNMPTKEDLQKIERQRVFDGSFDSVWAATIKSLAVHGVSVQSQDKTSGNISTDWVVLQQPLVFVQNGYRNKATIFLERVSAGRTHVTIGTTFEIKAAEGTPWRPFQAHERPKHFIDAEQRFFDMIQRGLPTKTPQLQTEVQPAAVQHSDTNAKLVPPPTRANANLVAGIQAALKINGYSVTADGQYGPKTKTAIADWQSKNGLPADGSPTQSLLDAMHSKSNSKEANVEDATGNAPRPTPTPEKPTATKANSVLDL